MKIKSKTKYFKRLAYIIIGLIVSIVASVLIIQCSKVYANNIRKQQVKKIKNEITAELDSLTGKELIRRCEILYYDCNSISVGNNNLDSELSSWIKSHTESKLIALAESGNIDACYSIGNKWERKAFECSNDDLANSYYQRAAYWFKQNADAGGSDGAAKLAEYYVDGWGVSKNEVFALKYARMAANKNNPLGMLLVGDFFYNGVIQEYEWTKDSTCYECIREKKCKIHTKKINRIILSNNNDSARWYWKKVVEISRGPGYFYNLRNRAKSRLEKIYE